MMRMDITNCTKYKRRVIKMFAVALLFPGELTMVFLSFTQVKLSVMAIHPIYNNHLNANHRKNQCRGINGHSIPQSLP